MTIERARELLKLDTQTDNEVIQVIADSKNMCRIMLKTIANKHFLLTNNEDNN